MGFWNGENAAFEVESFRISANWGKILLFELSVALGASYTGGEGKEFVVEFKVGGNFEEKRDFWGCEGRLSDDFGKLSKGDCVAGSDEIEVLLEVAVSAVVEGGKKLNLGGCWPRGVKPFDSGLLGVAVYDEVSGCGIEEIGGVGFPNKPVLAEKGALTSAAPFKLGVGSEELALGLCLFVGCSNPFSEAGDFVILESFMLSSSEFPVMNRDSWSE